MTKGRNDMVYGIELVLRLTNEQVIELFPEQDRPDDIVEMMADQDRRFEVYELLCRTPAARAVHDSYRPALEARFGPATVGTGQLDRGYLTVNTPTGRREFAPWTISTHGDEDFPDQVFGVSLLSRYKPVWLDWREDYGGSNGPIELGQETMDLVQWARDVLTPIVPAFATAPLTVVNQHY